MWKRPLSAVWVWLAAGSAALPQAPVETLAIGARAPRLEFVDTHYLPRSLSDYGSPAAFVLVFLTTDCPLAGRYLPRLCELERIFRARGVQFLGVNEGPGDDMLAVASQAVESGAEFPFGKDYSGDVARSLGVERSPQVVVLDREQRLRYRGRIDDQYRLGGVRAQPSREDLLRALEQVLAGGKVELAQTPVDGCRLTFPGPRRAERAPDFATEVQPILESRCASCHNPSGCAPFSLSNHAQAAAHASTIAEVVEQQRMPPWYASPLYGHFANDRRLSAGERQVLIDWALAGAPGPAPASPAEPDSAAKAQSPGASRPLPPRPWRIGEPDLVLCLASPISVPAQGLVPYAYLTLADAQGALLPRIFAEDTWVESVEIRPSNPRVLHHANLGHYRLGEGWKEQNFVTGYVPGGEPLALDAGTAVLIPKGAVLGLEIHHITNGREEQDQIEVGLRFPRGRVQQRLRHFAITDLSFKIPPAVPAHAVRASATFERDSTGIGLYAHMHLRGRDMRFDAHYPVRPDEPDGRSETLLLVPNYSFDWQQGYRWEKGAQRFPAGSRVDVLAHFDNSRHNPYNPDPAAEVRFGLQTTDEMMYGFLFYTEDAEALELKVSPKTGQVLPRIITGR